MITKDGIIRCGGFCTKSPILFRSCGRETRFLTKKGHQKSGIPCSGFSGDVLGFLAMCWFLWDATISVCFFEAFSTFRSPNTVLTPLKSA
jgi:hypothetical protein